jgi:predicted nucleotidyltransferase
MSEQARAASVDDLKSILQSLHANNVDYLLIGGYALAVHGYIRATTDIDLVVQGSIESGEKLIRALMILPDKSAQDIDPVWLTEGENIRVNDDFVIDIMLNANGHSYEALKQYEQIVDLDGIPVKTISLDGLLLTKQTMRSKDQSDCSIIERALQAIEEEKSRQEWHPRNRG